MWTFERFGIKKELSSAVGEIEKKIKINKRLF